MNAQKYFEQHAEELIASYAGKNVVLFFRGFVPANVRWLAHREDAVLPAGKILNEDGSISIAKIDVAKRKLVQSLMMQEEGVTVGIYEEMLAILQNVQDPKEMFDAEFIVVDNNAFPAYVPSCIPAEDAEALYKAYERPSLVLRKFSAITMQPSAHWMSVIMWHCSIGIRAKISAVFRSIRKSSPFLRTHRQRCPTKFLRWYWQTSSSAARWKVRWCCLWSGNRTPKTIPTMCCLLWQHSAARPLH